MKKYSRFFATALCLILFVAGCSGEVDVTPEDLSSHVQSLEEVIYPETAIIALGEATHGNRELTWLKRQVFEQLVEQQGVRAFAIEGDFGGSLTVNDYIQGGDGTPEEAVSQIGFAIYRTKELAELVEWMRAFNTGREEADRIRFYGYDMQRFDNNIAGLIGMLDRIAPERASQYRALLEPVTDDAMYDLDKSVWEGVLSGIESLNKQLEELRGTSIADQEFELLTQYAQVISQHTELRLASNYGTLRDSLMAKNVGWILEYEKEYYGIHKLFLTGHNGHIGKTTATFGTKACMGELLVKEYGPEYFSIGTEFYQSNFLAADSMTGERKEYSVTNSQENRLAWLLHRLGESPVYFSMANAVEDPALERYLGSPQPISSIGDSFSSAYTLSTKMYTQKLSPAKNYDAMIFLDTIQPAVMLVPQGQ